MSMRTILLTPMLRRKEHYNQLGAVDEKIPANKQRREAHFAFQVIKNRVSSIITYTFQPPFESSDGARALGPIGSYERASLLRACLLSPRSQSSDSLIPVP